MTQYSPGNTAGVAYFDQEWLVGAVEIFYSHAPEPVTQNFALDEDFYTTMLAAAAPGGIVIPYGYVVGISASGNVVAAVYNDPTVPLLGVVAAPVINDSQNAYATRDPAGADSVLNNDIELPVFVQGYFSIAGCTFPATFTDAAHKLAANKYSGGRNILFGRPAYDGIVSNPTVDLTTPPVGLSGSWDDSGVWTDSGAWHD